jgi:hypothetical protein
VSRLGHRASIHPSGAAYDRPHEWDGPGALTAALAGRLGVRNVDAVDPSEPFVQARRPRLPEANVRV